MWPRTVTMASAAAMIAMETATFLSNGSLACSACSCSSSLTDMFLKLPWAATMEASMVLFACAIFLSSFLLFLIQPIFAKLILPWFGGSSAVWIMCLVFFQVALLVGYVYAHFISARLRPQAQVWIHIGLL